jgi:ABC-2 type transport system permease protein
MRLIRVIQKSFREQLRSYWILLLTISMAPFFVAVYYLIMESYEANYDVIVVNNDKGVEDSLGRINHGSLLVDMAKIYLSDSSDLPFRVEMSESVEESTEQLKNRKADAVVVLPEDFSLLLAGKDTTDLQSGPVVEFIGDLTHIEYMISAVWANGVFQEYAALVREDAAIVHVKETSLGLSGSLSDFELMVPGLLILALIMLMFTGSIALVAEVENKTILRLKLSRLKTAEYLAGVSMVQVLVGLVSIFLTLGVAVMMGFEYTEAMGAFVFLAILTSISIFAFSLILAAFTKTVNEVLIVGNFPLFLFMFFTGAAFPLDGKALFYVAGYPLTVQGLMSPTHAISAMKKVLILESSLADVLPEMIAIAVLTVIYFSLGVWAFYQRHMRVG